MFHFYFSRKSYSFFVSRFYLLKMGSSTVVCMFLLAFKWVNAEYAHGALTAESLTGIAQVNQEGPYLGLVIPNLFELNPLLHSPNYTSSDKIIDFSGRRFRFGAIADKPVILVLTGLGMINAAITTQLLVSFFNVEGVVHYGTAGNANPSLNMGDVAIPQYWGHLGLWNWQKYGEGPEDELPLEAEGDYTREIGYLKIADYTLNVTDGNLYDNLLNNIWYQPQEVFPVDGIPEERQHVFWVPVDSQYFQISQKLENMTLERCIDSTTCLPTTPKVVRVQRGASASIFLANQAYRTFIHDKFNVSPMDMESAAVAVICLQQRLPFIAIRVLSGAFLSPAANLVTVVIEFIKQLSLDSMSSL